MSLSKYQSAEIHIESMRMLRRPSKILIVDEIMHSLFTKQDKRNKRCNNSSFYEMILIFCGCNIE